MSWGYGTWGATTWGASSTVSGSVRVPLPGLYIDNLRYSGTTNNLELFNTLPEAGETRVRNNAHIQFQLSSFVDEFDNNLQVWITVGDEAEVLAYDEAGAGFQNGFAGSSSSINYTQSPGSTVNDDVSVVLDPETTLPSNTLVIVRIAASSGTAADSIATSYSFTTQYTEAPVIDEILWFDPRTVRLRFRDSMQQDDSVGGTLYLKTLTGGMEFVTPNQLQVRNLTPSTDWIGYWIGLTGSAYPQNNGYFLITAVDSAAGTVTVDNATTASFISDNGIDRDKDDNVIRNRTLRGVISSYAFFANPSLEEDDVTCAYTPVVLSVDIPEITEIPDGADLTQYVIIKLHDDISISRAYTANLIKAMSTYDDVADTTSAYAFTSPAFGNPEKRIKLWDLFPELDKDEDGEEDDQLQKMTCVLQDLLNVMWYRCDTLQYLYDPYLAPDSWVPYLLYTLGNPFRIPLTLLEQRRLCDVLATVYKRAGTAQIIEDVLDFFIGANFTVNEFVDDDWWELGTSVLGTSTTLGPSSKFAKNAYEIIVDRELTVEEERAVVHIAETLDPVYMHLIRITVESV